MFYVEIDCLKQTLYLFEQQKSNKMLLRSKVFRPHVYRVMSALRYQQHSVFLINTKEIKKKTHGLLRYFVNKTLKISYGNIDCLYHQIFLIRTFFLALFNFDHEK